MRIYLSLLIGVFGVLAISDVGMAYATPLSVVAPPSVTVTQTGQPVNFPINIFGGQPYSGFNGSPDHYYLKVYDNTKLESEQNVNVGTYDYQFYPSQNGTYAYAFVVYDSLGNSAQGDTVIKVGTVQPLKNYNPNAVWNSNATVNGLYEKGTVGQEIIISSLALGGQPPYRFQFYNNGQLIQNGVVIESSGNIAYYQFYPSQAGRYVMGEVVWDSAGNDKSNATVVDVANAPANLVGGQTYNNGIGNDQGTNITSSDMTPAIVGILVLVVIIAIIAIAVAKKKKKQPIAPPNITSSTSSVPTYEGSPRSPVMPLDEDEKAGDKTEVRVNVSMDIKNGVVQLKCNNCGAALPPPKDKSNWVKCEHCGGGYYIPKNIFDKL